MPKPIAKLEQHIDYIHFVCEKCGQVCGVDYLGLDPSIPRIKLTCQNCGKLGVFKIEGAGPGFDRWTKQRRRRTR